MKWPISIFLLTALPALAQLPPGPPGVSPVKLLSPKHADHLASLGLAMAKVKPLVVSAPVATVVTLTWDYPTNQIPLVAFQLYAATTLTNSPPITSWDQVPNNFSLVAVIVGQTTYSFTTTQPQMFFIMRAQNMFSEVFSIWNQ